MSDPEPRFSEQDLAPSDEEKRAARRAIVERVATTAAVLATGVVIGGMVALGACAAPFVFRLTPPPWSGRAMGAAFARFDHIAIGASGLILFSEVARIWAAGRRSRTVAARLRRVAAVLFAGATAYMGLALTPQINALHRAATERDLGEARPLSELPGTSEQAAMLEPIHRRASLVGRVELALGAALIGLHIFTLGARRPDDDDDDFEDAIAPGAPGPRG